METGASLIKIEYYATAPLKAVDGVQLYFLFLNSVISVKTDYYHLIIFELMCLENIDDLPSVLK